MVLNKNSYFRSLMLIVMITSLLTPYSVLAQTNTEETKVDYYIQGKYTAKRDYSGKRAMLVGFASGTFYNIIGWGIGYLIIEGLRVDVPRRYTRDLKSNQRLDFEYGYTDYVKDMRKSKFNRGGLFGTLFSCWIIVSATNQPGLHWE